MATIKGIPNYYQKDFGVPTPATTVPKSNSLVAPVSAPKLTPAPVVTPPKIAQPKGFWGKAMDVISLPSKLTEKYGTKLLSGGKYQTYDTALNAAGIQNTPGKLDLNDVISTTGRVVADPLNFLPVGKIAKGLGWVGSKIPGVSNLMKGASGVAKVVKSTPIFNKVANAFVKGRGVPEDVTKGLDNILTTVGSKSEDIVAARKALYKGLSDDEITAVARFLEPQGAGAGVNLGQLRSQLGSRFDEVLKPILKFEKNINKEEVVDAALRGNLRSGTAKELYNNPYLYHYTEKPGGSFFSKVKELFTPGGKLDSTKATAILPKSKFKISGEYWKPRTGSDFSLNTPLVQTKRQIMQVKDNAIQDAVTAITNKYGVKLNTGQAVPEGFRYIKVPTGAKEFLTKFKGIVVPKNIAGYIEQSYHQSGNFTKAIDTLNRAWKPLATSYNPSFTINNMIGNIYNSFLGGVKSPKRFTQMVKGGFTKTEEALVKEAGFISKSEFAGDVAKEAFAKAGAGSFVKKAVTGLNRGVENNARKALFLDAFEKFSAKGLSKEEAMSKAVGTVDKFLFDYQSSLTPFEQNVMKRIFPFYTWARKNMPLQAESLVTQTGKPAAVLKLIQNANGGEMPQDLSIPTPFKNKEGKNLKYKIQLPLGDVANFANTSTGRDMTSPFIKMATSALNYAMGGEAPTDYYTGKQLTNKNLPIGEQARDLSSSYFKSLIKWARTAEKIGQDKSVGNVVRSVVGGFSAPQSAESIMSNKVYTESDKKKALRSEINKSIKSGDINRAKRLEKLLGK